MKRCLSSGNVGTVDIESSDIVTDVVTQKPHNNKKNHYQNQIIASQPPTSYALTPELHNLSNTHTFKKQLKTYLFHKAYS